MDKSKNLYADYVSSSSEIEETPRPKIISKEKTKKAGKVPKKERIPSPKTEPVEEEEPKQEEPPRKYSGSKEPKQEDNPTPLVPLLESLGYHSSLFSASHYTEATQLQIELLKIAKEHQHIMLVSPKHSGKAFGVLLVMYHKMLNLSEEEGSRIVGVYLMPNGKFAGKVSREAEYLSCKGVKVVNITSGAEGYLSSGDVEAQRILFIATVPSFFELLQNEFIKKEELRCLCVDEVNIFSTLGKKSELEHFAQVMGKQLAGIPVLMTSSYALNEKSLDVKKKILTFKPVTIKLQTIKEESDQLLSGESGLVKQYYYMGPELNRFSLLFMILRLKVIEGKTIIVCNSQEVCCKVKMFFDRAWVPKSAEYNLAHPVAARSYMLSTYSSLSTDILVVPPGFLADIKNIERGSYATLPFIDNIVFFDRSPSPNEYADYVNVFAGAKSKSLSHNLFFIVDPTQMKEDHFLNFLMDHANSSKIVNSKIVNHVKAFPLEERYITAFNTMVGSVVDSLGKRYIKLQHLMDMDRLVLRSKSMKEYFSSHPEEVSALREKIQGYAKTINKYTGRMSPVIPSYLIPEFLQNKQSSIIPKVLKLKVGRGRPGKGLGGQKPEKKVKTENDTAKLEEEHDPNAKYMYIKPEKEDPSLVAAEELKPTSARKLWKLQHGYRLKKRNFRLEKKGIFNY